MPLPTDLPDAMRGPSEQLDLFAQAAEQRQAALVRVEEHADDGWLSQALEAVRQCAQRYPEFISDVVWEYTDLPHTREDRALGSVFLKAARQGWIKKTDRVRPSVRSNLSPKPVWRSLIYERES